MNRMSAQDASFLHVESDSSPMHVGGVSIFEGPPPPFADVVAIVDGKLPLVPRYRQVIRTVPLSLAEPVWVDDPHFNLGYHLRQTALPAPGDEGQLRTLVGRVMSQNLDRAKPLWELWLVEGLEQGRWALLSKVHHCMVDGIAGTDLMTVVLDRARDASTLPTSAWDPGPGPGTARLVADALVDRTRNPFAAAGQALGSLRSPRQLAGTVVDTSRGLLAIRRRRRDPIGLVAQRAAGPPPALGLGAGEAVGRPAGPPSGRRHGQRRRAGRDHRGLPRAAAVARRVGRPRAPHAGAGVGAPAR